MDAIDLTEEQRRVYEKLAELETPERGVREDELARALDLEGARVREALRALVGEHDLVREQTAADDPALGSRYRVKDTAG